MTKTIVCDEETYLREETYLKKALLFKINGELPSEEEVKAFDLDKVCNEIIAKQSKLSSRLRTYCTQVYAHLILLRRAINQKQKAEKNEQPA
jgi:hypothetical protein